ncbi:MAG: hypothetical protein WA162_06760 [Thermodesulfobacteriota bacterium]
MGKTRLNIVITLLAMFFPVILLSDLTRSFNPSGDGAVKIAFKKSGKRVVECDEKELTRKLGAAYRESVREGKGAAVDMSKLSACPSERHPVSVIVLVDGEKVLDKDFKPKGLRKDLASYVHETLPIKAGTHGIVILMSDDGKLSWFYSIDAEVSIGRDEIVLVGFDPAKDTLIIR